MLNIQLARKALNEIVIAPADDRGNRMFNEAVVILSQFIEGVAELDRRKCITRPAALLLPPVKGV